MGDLLAKLRIGTFVYHAIAAVALLVLLAKIGMMAAWCIFPGALIACGSVPSMPGRPISLYAAFGSLLGLSFWMAVSAINGGFYLDLIPILMLVIGASWLLSDPTWPSALFTWVAVGLNLGLLVVVNQNRHQIGDPEPEITLKALRTTSVLLGVGLGYSILGFAEVILGLKRRRKKKKSMGIRTPEGPPSF